ncbi:MAG: hypothetical protein A2041_08850 [Bacteroidetes bacterium GWA2_31_9b]|nr:MAG: hypothetical protein A2041_08850 [Bacteroidetes bacterium GWA2_31_9b]
MAFLRFILIFFLVLYILRIVTQFIFKRYLKKIQKQFDQQQEFYKHQNSKEGDVIIEKTEQSTKKVSKNDGEYVDYEEIK